MRVIRTIAAPLMAAGVMIASPAQAGAAQEQLLQQHTDSATGAAIRIHRQATGALSLEVDSPVVGIRKAVTGGRSVTRLRHGRDEVTIEFDGVNLTVVDRAGAVVVTPEHADRIEAARRKLAGSPVVAKAAQLIGRLDLPANSPARLPLLTTRAILLSASGDRSGAVELNAWIQTARSGARVVRVGLQGMTATDCWNEYAKEAIAAYMEYEECMKNEQWWDLLGQTSCALVYDMRAIGAMSWWISCVGLRG